MEAAKSFPKKAVSFSILRFTLRMALGLIWLCMLSHLHISQHNVWCSSESSSLHGFRIILSENPQPVYRTLSAFGYSFCNFTQIACFTLYMRFCRTLASTRRATTQCRPPKGNRSPSSSPVILISSSKRCDIHHWRLPNPDGLILSWGLHVFSFVDDWWKPCCSVMLL